MVKAMQILFQKYPKIGHNCENIQLIEYSSFQAVLPTRIS